MNVQIDLGDIASEFDLTKEEVDDMMEYTIKSITESFARKWDTEANILGSSRTQYKNAIQIGDRGRFTGVVYLNPAAWLPNALEMGIPEFDMKDGFLGSQNAKIGTKGPYITIPFRFATPGSIGESGIFAGVMPQDVQAAVKKREQETPASPGLRLGDISKKHQIPQSSAMRKRIKAMGFEQAKAKSDKMTSIYQGLKRAQAGSGYVTFRRVSLNSEPESWMHPGFAARDLAGKALSKMDIQFDVDRFTDQYLSNLGFS